MSAELDDSELYNASTTVMFVDVVEYVRLVERNETVAVRRIRSLLSACSEPVSRLGGRVVQQMGDSVLLTFPDPSSAVACASELHALASSHSDGLSDDERLFLRVGIHSSNVLTDDHAVFGHGVNLAARLMTIAGPAQTIVSSSARDLLTTGLDGDIEDLGNCYVKHVAEPVRAYRVLPAGDWTMPPPLPGESGGMLPRIAVLPFEEYGNQGKAIGVGDVLTDQLIAVFSRSPSLHVISRLSSHALRGRDLPMEEVRRRLGADYVLSGRFRAVGRKLTLMVELVQTDTKRVLWANEVRGSVVDALEADSDVVGEIARSASAAIVRTELTAARTGSLPNVSSHALYLFAISVLHRFSREEFERAKLMLEALRERAPRHPAPLAWLARWYMLRTVQGWSGDPAADGRRAMECAQRALDIDPASSLALTMAGAARRSVERDFEGAQAYFERALQTNPNEPLAWLFKGTIHGMKGESESALVASDRALTLSPLDPMRSYYESLSATAATGAGAYERAITLAQSALRGNVNHASSYRTMAISQAMLGRVDEAKLTVSRLREIEPAATVEAFIARAGGTSPLIVKFATALETAGLPAH